MIAKEFETFLLGQEETFLTPAENLAVLIDTHNADHATLLLSQMTYTRVPVVTDEKQFVGTIGLRDIMAYQMEHDLSQEIMADTDIVHMTKTDVAVVSPDFTITEVLHKLVDESFLPVVDWKSVHTVVSVTVVDFLSVDKTLKTTLALVKVKLLRLLVRKNNIGGKSLG